MRMARCGASATPGSAGHLRSTELTACVWISTQCSSILAMRTAVLTVFCCVASRNKRAHRASYWLCLPQQLADSTLFQFDFTVGRPGGTATLGAERRVAGRPGAGVRPARLCEPQELHHQHCPDRLSSVTRPAVLRTAKATPIHPRARYSLSAYSCLPPAVNATSPDELQSAAWGGGELRGSKSRRSSAQSTDPCPPHCGSAFAPPLSPSPAAILGIGRAPTGRICLL